MNNADRYAKRAACMSRAACSTLLAITQMTDSDEFISPIYSLTRT
ncbi:hypothetical protein [Paenibacillus sp. 1781tsa1]|nr:hypothetical protein [Paenibacillus sp. 1781tsa1]